MIRRRAIEPLMMVQRLRSLVAVASVLVLLGGWGSPVEATSIRGLPFPPGARADTQTEGHPVSANASGTVAVSSIVEVGLRTRFRIVVWNPAGERRIIDPPHAPEEQPGPSPATSHAVVAPNGTVYGVATYPFDGAYLGEREYLIVATSDGVRRVTLHDCGGSDWYTPLAVALDNRVALVGRFTSTTGASGVPPKAIVLAGATCRPFDDGWLAALDGRYAAGYRGPTAEDHSFIDHQPSVGEPTPRRPVAIRWTGPRAQELGFGMALGVNAHGDCVGADAAIDDPMHRPNAVVWSGRTMRRLLPRANGSIAYGINESGLTIVGTSFDRSGQHAVRWQRGTMERLDMFLAPDSGWHLTVAYGVTSDGAIYGLGEHRGKPAVFVLSVT